MEDKVPSKLERAIEQLNQDPYLLATITAVPFVGGSITQVLTGIGQQIVQERHARLFEQLSKHLAEVDEESLRRDYFETPEGFDLLIKAMDESRRTRSDEKRDFIARILAGATLTESEQSEYHPEEYLNLVTSLTVKELEVARTLYALQLGQNYRNTDDKDKSEAWKAQRDEIANTHALDPSDLTLILDRIASTGLIELSYVMYVSGLQPTYWVTRVFDRLMGFLKLE